MTRHLRRFEEDAEKMRVERELEKALAVRELARHQESSRALAAL